MSMYEANGHPLSNINRITSSILLLDSVMKTLRLPMLDADDTRISQRLSLT